MPISIESWPPGCARRALGWQGYTARVPDAWNPGKIGGNRARGDLRVDDESGVRLELRWETPAKTPDIPRSVANFLNTLTKDAKKRGAAFHLVEDARVVSKHKKGKTQATSFGWIGDPKAPSSCGFGAAWFCPVCERVSFAHVVGHAGDRSERISRLASEILGPMECHGEGGWDSWSVFDVRLDVPSEFELARSQLLLNKIELEWVRARPIGPLGWGRRAERLKVTRWPAASVILADTSLPKWAQRHGRDANKALRLGEGEPDEVNGHPAQVFRGGPKDPRAAFAQWFLDRLARRRTPPGELRVWNCELSNRLWALESEVSSANAHVPRDVLESLRCH